jgi:8-oxo-dGTP pyrophosphatase MutT (NUDIX family)
MRELFRDQFGNEHVKPHDREVKQRFSARGVCIQNDRALVIRPVGSDKWEVPGGRIELGEDIQSAINREFEEETGYSGVIVDLKPILVVTNNFFDIDNDIYFDSKIDFYRVLSLEDRNAERIIQNGESEIVEWVAVNLLNTDNCRPLSLQAVQKCI